MKLLLPLLLISPSSTAVIPEMAQHIFTLETLDVSKLHIFSKKKPNRILRNPLIAEEVHTKKRPHRNLLLSHTKYDICMICTTCNISIFLNLILVFPHFLYCGGFFYVFLNQNCKSNIKIHKIIK